MITNVAPVYDYEKYSAMKNISFEPSDDRFFHYTSSGTCFKMLENKTIDKDDGKIILELWATHTRFMNDSKEMTGGCEDIEKFLVNEKKSNILEEFKKIIPKTDSNFNAFALQDPNHYSISFCGKNNLLSQWTYYGAKTGVAIEYDLNNCFLKGDSSNIDEWSDATRPYKILYKNNDKEIKIRAVLKAFSDGRDDNYNTEITALQLLYLSSFMKDEAYCEESESRLLFTPYYTIGKNQNEKMNKVLSLIKFRESNGIILPYLPIQIKHKESNKFPIKSITVGPGRNQEFVFNSLILFIQSNFQTTDSRCKDIEEEGQFKSYMIGDIILRRSLIPFRG